MELSEFMFDVTLAASVRVKAKTKEEAVNLLRSCIDCADANLGAWPDGEPILCEVSVIDESPELIEIDGEAV